ncbi:hypothetical protein BD779DRAFT_1701131 [Infundibulicybe gibba]|nr:hypothetical protein BD779DRAFT_1701131 [Infundibulicybe gibba]
MYLSKHLTSGCLIASILTAAAQVTQLPYDPSPFMVAGYITGATVNNLSDILSGGTLTLEGIYTIVIPQNLLVNTPQLTAVSWRELFNSDGTINLPLWPTLSWEATVFANFINGQRVAGIVYIIQEVGNLNEGFINFIDYEKGEIRVGGSFDNPSTTGARVVINDPVGRFGLVRDAWPLWAADTDNPSIFASPGFPMCLPRVDPAVADDPFCPKRNRPVDTQGKPLTAFTFEAPPVIDGHPDPNLFAPLAVGDFIIYSATVVPDGDEHIFAAYMIEANLGFYTTPGTTPAYVRIETLQAGINGNPAGEIQETRVEGYITDETATIEIFAIDVDPCTGVKTERNWGSAIPRLTDCDRPLLGRRGQWEFRSSDPTLSPYTREVGARVSTGTITTPNGIMAGQLITPFPTDGFLFPELIIFGDPQIPLEFNLIPFIALGSGPWLGGIPGVPKTATGPIVGQLSPWPGVTQPVPIVCPVINPLVPIADAGSDITTFPGANVTLVGAIKNDNTTSVGTLKFLWAQLSGPSVQLQSANTGTASFIAPTVSVMTSFTFRLNVTNNVGVGSDDVMVVVNPFQVDHITFESVTWQSGKGSGTLTVIADTDNLSSVLFMSAMNPNIATIPMSPLGGGRWQAIVMVRPAPSSVTITSSLGASASSFVST